MAQKQEEEEEVKKSFAHLPYDVTEHCLAIAPRRHYPNLSLASKSFRRILRSPELYQRRSTLGVTEPVLYASVGFPPSQTPSWHTLHRNHFSLRLLKIASLPSRLLSAVATVGTEMYVLGGSVGGNPTSDVNLIDCRFHTSQTLPRMKRALSRAVAGAIDGKVYVIGGCRKKSDDWVEVFDVKTQAWRDMPAVLPRAHWEGQFFVTCAVMDDKIFVLDPSATCLVFDPRVGALVEWDDGVEMRSLWQASSCVVDDMLYTVDPGCSLKHPIVVYDPKAEERRWRPVYGVDLKKDLPPFDSWYDSKMANHGGKLVILIGSNPWPCFHHGRQDVWCVEIALERQGDDIWGHVESTTLVLTSRKWPSIELSRSVTL
ncbi:unnamed protein product [Brassica napus]|nr:unnamed protein product [Brassica napus]